MSGLSAPQISKELNINIKTVYNSLIRSGIVRRTAKQAGELSFINKKLSFEKPKVINEHQKLLFASALMLYLGEGNKRDSSTVDLANSDPAIVLIFLKALREIYKIDEKRIRVQLYCHYTARGKIGYWSKLLGINKNQFTKPYVVTGNSVVKNGKMKFGLVHIRYSDKKLWLQIMNDLENVKNQLLG